MNSIRSMVLVSSDPKSLKEGAQKVFEAFEKEIKVAGLENEVELRMVEDFGRHESVPMVVVYPEAVVYGPVKPTNVHHLVEEHLTKGNIATELQMHAEDMTGKIAWIPARKGALPAEQRIVLKNIGIIDPEKIEDYVAHEGYEGLKKALTTMKPDEVYSLVEKSGLRGRGGAGFPTGTKWKFVARTADDKKYIICNADESEPGTFKDRIVLEGDPHAILRWVQMKVMFTSVGNTVCPKSACKKPSNNRSKRVSWDKKSSEPILISIFTCIPVQVLTFAARKLP